MLYVTWFMADRLLVCFSRSGSVPPSQWTRLSRSSTPPVRHHHMLPRSTIPRSAVAHHWPSVTRSTRPSSRWSHLPLQFQHLVCVLICISLQILLPSSILASQSCLSCETGPYKSPMLSVEFSQVGLITNFISCDWVSHEISSNTWFETFHKF